MNENILNIAVSDIEPDPENLRKTFDPADIEALAENILEIGQTDPIQVFVRNVTAGRTVYDLFDGERRWRAAKAKGLPTLKAFVIPRPTNGELLVRKISRMMQTRDYSFQEQVTAIETGLRALGVSETPEEWGHVAPKLGVKPELLRERMRVLRLSPGLRQLFFEGQLDYTVAQQLGRLDDHRRQEETADFISRYHLSNRFVTAKFMSVVIKHSGKPLIELYDLARKELADGMYAKARLGGKADDPLEKRINDYVDSILLVEKALEQGARGGFFKLAFASDFERARILGSLVRLKHVIDGFLRAVEDQRGDNQNAELPSSDLKRLPGSN